MGKFSNLFYLRVFFLCVSAYFFCSIIGNVMVLNGLELIGDDSLGEVQIDESMGKIQSAIGVIKLGKLFVLFGIIAASILIFRLWTAIQGPDARTTPGKAVGFLFIPFFNFYWIFQALWGWAQDYNKNAKSLQLSVPEISEGMALATCISLCLVPVFGVFAALTHFILLIIFFHSAVDGVNVLAGNLAATAEAEVYRIIHI